MLKSIRTFIALVSAVSLFGCAEAKKALDAASGGLTAADVAKAWVSTCNAGSDPLSGGDHWKDYLTLNADGSYSDDIFWYTGTCLGANYLINYANNGAFAISGSTIVFDIAASSIMSFTTAAQTGVNNGCGGTSPYASGVNVSYNGHGYNTFVMTCFNQTLPSAADHLVGNMIELSGGVLMLGLGDETVPGVFSGAGSLPTSTSTAYY